MNDVRADHLRTTGRDLRWAEVARSADMVQSVMSDIVTLRRRLQIEEAKAIAEVLGVRACWLVFGEGPRRALDAETAAIPELPSIPVGEGRAVRVAEPSPDRRAK